MNQNVPILKFKSIQEIRFGFCENRARYIFDMEPYYSLPEVPFVDT